MRRLRWFLARLAGLVRQNARERDLDAELRFHLDEDADERVAAGLSALEARRAAKRRVGNVAITREAMREAWMWPSLESLRQDATYAIRLLLRRPTFAFTALLSLALGIGANTAIFGLWNGVLLAPLPGVERPDGLVMLTDPGAAGIVRGRSAGFRRWLSYAEFQQLREQSTSFAGLMASQSSLNEWDVRVDGGDPEEMRGRLVSDEFFEVLGIRAMAGRLFATGDDRRETGSAVISYAFWQRRFGGRADVLGKALTIHETPVSVIGITPASFVGETAGQQPDVWLPLRLQPRVLPGSDWLHDQPPDKVMWLHVFGRLTPGINEVQAEAESNAVFRAGLESFYGAMQRDEAAGQQLRLQSGARGASPIRDGLSSSLAVLLGAVGLLLLVTCANLANLLLARGSTRQPEIAVRLALGASRARVIRQLVTESLTLGALGGLAGLGAAYLMHGALLRLLQEAEPSFSMNLALTVPVLAFATVVTMASALLFGALPAWQFTRTDPGSRLKDSSRGAAGSRRDLRAGRGLVAAQLALSLPLVFSAGLLSRTAYNLQRPELGFQTDRLVVARVDLGVVALDPPRRDRVLRALLDRVRRVSGVEAANFSQRGLFSGGISTASIEVSGDSRPHDSGLDRVGAGYFTTLGIPIRRGRDFSDRDRADSQTVCLVNDAFVERFFAGRDPIGLHVTAVDVDPRSAYEIVGIVGNARTDSLRTDLEPRFFVPAEQRRSQAVSRTFLIRTRIETAGMITSLRQALSEVDAAVAVSSVVPLGEQMAPLTAQDRTTAQITAVFGIVALMLAAVGLYGMLSCGVARRSREIAVRIALGAQSRGIIIMILRETTALIVTGLVLGSGLTYLASRLIANRLYGVTPYDPATLSLAVIVLLFVALAAAYLPAKRASRLAPMSAIRQS